MPGTVIEVDVCVCFSNNCNGKDSSDGGISLMGMINGAESSNGEMKSNDQGMEKKDESAGEGISLIGIVNQTESSDGKRESSDGERELNDWEINLGIKNTAGESSGQGIGKREESSDGENESKWGISLSIDNTSGESSDGTSMAKVSISILLLMIPFTLF